MPRIPIWVYASVALTILVSLYGLSLRHKAEAGNRAVGLTAEADSIQQLADLSGVPFEEALAKLKDAGLTAVTLPEDTVTALADVGRVSLNSHDGALLVTIAEKDQARVESGLTARGIAFRDDVFPDHFKGTVTVGVHATPAMVLNTPIGLDPEISAAITQAGLPILARHANYPGANAASILNTLQRSKEMGAVALLPMGDTLLGFKSELDSAVKAVEATGLQYITVEFGKMPGDSRVRTALPLQTIRMHSVQGAEMDKLTPAEFKERFTKAARERQIHWLLMRPQSTASDQPLQDFANQILTLNKALTKEGLVVKMPRPFDAFAAPNWYCVLMALVSLPVLVWLILQVPISQNLRYAGAAIAILVGLACWSPAARNWYGLAAAIAFPILAYVDLLGAKKRNPILQYAIMALISLAGGLVIASTLIGTQFMLQNKLFVGPKLAHYAPILVAALMLLSAQIDLKETMKKPLVWGTTLASFAILAALFFMQTRLGNDNPAGVSGIELKLRAILDSILFVRPRTKEFLIGNPALLLGLFLWSKEKKLWGSLFLGVGAIGLTSIVNTLCHLHIPVELSLARIVIGLILGGIIALIIWAGYTALARRERGLEKV